MSFLLDTNLISEVRKGAKCNRLVWNWYQTVPIEELFLSVLTIGEIRRGIELCRLKDTAKARIYEVWLNGLEIEFKERILPVTAEVADLWGVFRFASHYLYLMASSLPLLCITN